MPKRVIVTGGSGKAGRHVLKYLLDKGYDVLNLDLIPCADNPQVPTLITDLTDSGQVFNAFSTYFNYKEVNRPNTQHLPSKIDAVVHLAAVPSLLLKPDNETYRVNVMSTYNVLEAASKLGIKKIIIASSETTYGVCFFNGHRDFDNFPIEEEYDTNPVDSYALSKICNEKTARGFALRFGSDIYALRIGNVVVPHEYERDFPAYLKDPSLRFGNAWSYIDARDLGQIIHLAINKDGLGFQVFNATNSFITTHEPTLEVLKKYAPNVKISRELDEFEAPLSNRKIRQVLGFKDEHHWQKYVPLEK